MSLFPLGTQSRHVLDHGPSAEPTANGVPLDALRALETEGAIGSGKLYPAYYVIPGNQGSPAVRQRVGQEIASDLKKDHVEGVLFVAT
jgi:Glycine/sarcosine/betaine reductase selenoprotein B (GRDB)